MLYSPINILCWAAIPSLCIILLSLCPVHSSSPLSSLWLVPSVQSMAHSVWSSVLPMVVLHIVWFLQILKYIPLEIPSKMLYMFWNNVVWPAWAIKYYNVWLDYKKPHCFIQVPFVSCFSAHIHWIWASISRLWQSIFIIILWGKNRVLPDWIKKTSPFLSKCSVLFMY